MPLQVEKLITFLPVSAGSDPTVTVQVPVSSHRSGSLEADVRAIPSGPWGMASLLVFVLVILLLIKPESALRQWIASGLHELITLLSPLRGPRYEIHDKPYLSKVLREQFRGRKMSEDGLDSESNSPDSKSIRNQNDSSRNKRVD